MFFLLTICRRGIKIISTTSAISIRMGTVRLLLLLERVISVLYPKLIISYDKIYKEFILFQLLLSYLISVIGLRATKKKNGCS